MGQTVGRGHGRENLVERRPMRVAISIFFAFLIPLSAARADVARREPLRDAIPTIHIQGSWPPDASPSATTDDAGHFWGDLWRRHRMHLLWVFTAQEVEHLYGREVGVSRSPLLFHSVPGIDATSERALSDDTSAETFVSQNKTNVFRFVAAGTILAANGAHWRSGVDDFIGLLEAQKFDSAATGMVKMIVGRERPSVEQGLEPADSHGGRLSFYSYATSQAFTMATYLDGVAARRLEFHPVWRGFAAGGLYGLATYIGYTRLEQGEHHLTDVLAGAGAGFLTGRLFYRFNHRQAEDAPREGVHRFRIEPPIPVQGGFALMMSFDLSHGAAHGGAEIGPTPVVAGP